MNVALRSFAGGEISPSLYGRADLAKYQSSLRQLRNFVVQKEGGVSLRPGWIVSGATKESALNVRLIPFIASDDDADKFAIEMGDGYLRWHQGGAPVVLSGVGAWVTATTYAAGNTVAVGGSNYYCILAHTSGATSEPGTGTAWQTYWYQMPGNLLEIPTPYAASDLFDLQYVQDQNTVSLVHPLYPPMDLVRNNGQWTLTSIAFGPSISAPSGLSLTGGGVGAQLFWAITAVNSVTGEESLATMINAVDHVPSAGTPTVLSWALVSGVTEYNIYRSTDGFTWGYIGTVSGSALDLASNTTWLVDSASVTTGVLETWVVGTQAEMHVIVAAPTTKATDGKYTIHGELTVEGSGGTSTTQGRIRVFYSRDGEAAVDAGILFTSTVLRGDGTLGPISFSGTVSVPDNGYSSLDIFLQPEVYGTAIGGTPSFYCAIDETVVGDNAITWTSAGTSFKDTDQAADLTQLPPTATSYFKQAGDYPSCVGSFQQRRWYGRSNNNKNRLWASRVGSPHNFINETPLLASSAISFDLAGKKSIEVRHLLDLARLVAFTASEEKIIEGEYQSGIIKPDAINVRSYTYHGSAKVIPLLIGPAALYVQARGNQVRSVQYGSQSADVDLTVMARHLFRGRQIVDWAYAENPDSIVWVVRDDGTLMGLTFLTDQDVWGWHRHDTLGIFESVCVLPEGTEDRTYAVVKRTINGSTVRYVERMEKPYIGGVTDIRDAHFMDAGILAYDGRNTDSTNSATLSGGTTWETSELLTLTASKTGAFSAGDVGVTFLLIGEDGQRLYFTVSSYTSDTIVQGYGQSIVPSSLQGAGTTDWARCTSSLSNLQLLAGEAVSVLADGLVLSSPNNVDNPHLTVDSGGNLSLNSPFSVVRVGLPFIGDIETLDIDSASPTSKIRKRVISRVILFLANSAGLWVGESDQPTAADPLYHLEEVAIRDSEDYNSPTGLVTDSFDIMPIMSHNTNGRVFLRQVNPLPTTVLMIAPSYTDE